MRFSRRAFFPGPVFPAVRFCRSGGFAAPIWGSTLRHAWSMQKLRLRRANLGRRSPSCSFLFQRTGFAGPFWEGCCFLLLAFVQAASPHRSGAQALLDKVLHIGYRLRRANVDTIEMIEFEVQIPGSGLGCDLFSGLARRANLNEKLY